MLLLSTLAGRAVTIADMQRGTRKTNRRAVYEDLRRRILALELQPGATLSENELAAELGVSRTPVRESLILLADEGLVQVFPKVGSFVSRVDPQRVADAQFLREAVELASLKDLPPAGELDEDVLASLRANLEQQQRPMSSARCSSSSTRPSITGCSSSAAMPAPGPRSAQPRGISIGPGSASNGCARWTPWPLSTSRCSRP